MIDPEKTYTWKLSEKHGITINNCQVFCIADYLMVGLTLRNGATGSNLRAIIFILEEVQISPMVYFNNNERKEWFLLNVISKLI